MHGWRYLLILNICLMGYGAYALGEKTLSLSSEVLDQKEFQRATAESSDVAYARVFEEQKALREEAEARVQGLQHMTLQEIRTAVSAAGDGTEEGTLARVSAGGPDPMELKASEKRVRLLHGFTYAILAVLAGWLAYWGWQKAVSASA